MQATPQTTTNATSSTTQEVGYVLSIRGSIIYLDGLPSAKIMDLLETEQGIRAVVAAIFENQVQAWVLDEGTIFPGQLFKKSANKLQIAATPSLLGRTINAVGVTVDGKGPISKTRATLLDFERPAKPLKDRQFIDTQLVTGLTLVDTLIPIGKGQRQLILGDAHSGKTSFIIDLIAESSAQGMICILASLGKPISELRKMIDILTAAKAMSRTIIVAATATDTSPLIFLTPQAAFSLAEFFQEQGLDVLIVLDDLGLHAKIYRELALLGGLVPGRESYPADMFYAHAHLLERAGRFNKTVGGGSITALPVIELPLNDFTTYIPTNVMSMTDGHLLFKSSLRTLGQRPAVDISLSVSRVGRQTQNRIQNALSFKIKQVLSEAQSLETVSKFSGELPPQTQSILFKRDLIMEILKQDSLSPVSLTIQTLLLSLVFTTFYKGKNKLFFVKNRNNLVKFFNNPPANIGTLIKSIFQLKSLDQLFTELETIVPKMKEVIV
jgi:F-type H+/Na+-transporting ATPase subunit alpha